MAGNKLAAEFGLAFGEDGLLKTTADGSPFVFDVYNGDRARNQRRYEAACEAAMAWIQEYMVSRYKCERVAVPLATDKDAVAGEPQCDIFVSADFYSNADRLLVVIQGSGAVRPGVWSRKAVMNEGLNIGSVLPYLDAAVAAGYSFIVLNPNENYAGGRSIRGNDSPTAHGVYVWKTFVGRSPAAQVDVVAHSYGGVVTCDLVSPFHVRPPAAVRINRIAFTDAVHSVSSLPNEAQDWLNERAINWVRSSKPLDTVIDRVRGRGSGCLRVSAGHPEHEYTSGYCKASALDWILGRATLNDFVKGRAAAAPAASGDDDDDM